MTTTIKLINIYIISHNYLPPPFLLWTSLASHLLPLLSTNTWICLVIHSRGFPQCLRLSLWALSLLCNCLSRFFSLKASGCCSVVPLRLTLRDPMYCSMPGFPVLNCTPEFAETHVHWVNDAIQPSYPLLPPSPPALNLSQHQGLFQWVSSLHQVTKVLELRHQSFQWIFRVDFLYDGLVWFPCCPRDSQESSPAPQFKSINSSVLSFLYNIL